MVKVNNNKVNNNKTSNQTSKTIKNINRKDSNQTNQGSKNKNKKRLVKVPTNNKDKLVDLDIMKPHNFFSEHESTMIKIYEMNQLEKDRYELENEPACVSTILKLILHVRETNPMSDRWSYALWDISQESDLLPDSVQLTFVTSFERLDNDKVLSSIKKRNRLAVLSSDSDDSSEDQSISVAHDYKLGYAIKRGDSVVSFGCEVMVTAPNEMVLEEAVTTLKNYFETNDETRGLKFEIDINKQEKPFILYPPIAATKNKDVSYEMTSLDAGMTALFVDSGGDRTLGSEYLGVSVGKIIRSHAAYNFKNQRALFVGNNAVDKTYTLGGVVDEAAQTYLSKVASRAYLLTNQKVIHFVMDDHKTVKQLETFPLRQDRKVTVDVSNGYLNMLEPIENDMLKENPSRVVSVYPTHINNIITLLSQFRDSSKVSVNDDFSTITRDLLNQFMVENKYWSYDARKSLDNVRLFIDHQHFKTLSSFGQYIAQRVRTNKDMHIQSALKELDSIINKNILPSIPSLDSITHPIIDRLVNAKYGIIDLTGTSVGSIEASSNSASNVYAIAYLNLILPSLKNGEMSHC